MGDRWGIYKFILDNYTLTKYCYNLTRTYYEDLIQEINDLRLIASITIGMNE
jgi:hypothetical protein